MPSDESAPSITWMATVLYEASLERMEEAEILRARRCWVCSMYLAGLAVECVLQAHAIRRGAARDAQHDLDAWLLKCPARLQNTIRDHVGEQWERIRILWMNGLRYMSEAGLLGHLRRKGPYAYRQVRGGGSSIMKVNAERLVSAARAVHQKGIVVWNSLNSTGT